MCSVRKILSDAFIEPVKIPGLRRTYLAALISAIGFTSLPLYVVLDIASLGLSEALTYFLGWFGFCGFMFMPGSFLLIRGKSFRFFWNLIFPLQLITLPLLLAYSSLMPLWLLTIMLVVIECPFWAVYHITMMVRTTNGNRGNEVGTMGAGLGLGVFLGALITGAVIAAGYGFTVITAGSIMLISGFLMLSLPLIAEEKSGSCSLFLPGQKGDLSGAIKMAPEQIIGTCAAGMFYSVTIALAPLWMKFLGLGSVAVGVISALRSVTRFIVTPIGGFLTNNRPGDEAVVGASLIFAGWLPWLFIQAPFLLLFSECVWASGNQMYNTGLMSRWYERKTLADLAIWEVALGIGRVSILSVAVPLLFISVESFIWAAVGASCFILMSGFIIHRRLKLKRPLVPASALAPIPAAE